MQRKIKRFYHRHKNEFVIAGLIFLIILSLAVLAVVYMYNHKRIKPEDIKTATEETVKREIKSGIPGSEVKKELKSLKEDDGYTIVVCTKELLEKRKSKELTYVVYPLTASKYPVEITESGQKLTLFGITYGNSLTDSILLNTGDGRYYTNGGQMKKSEYAVRNNYEKGTKKTVITKNRFHAYDEETSMEIPDDEMFEKFYIYDADEKEIGCFYY